MTFKNLKAGGTLQLEQEQKKLPLTSVKRENMQPERSRISRGAQSEFRPLLTLHFL